jgi:hypothetical protein
VAQLLALCVLAAAPAGAQPPAARSATQKPTPKGHAEAVTTLAGARRILLVGAASAPEESAADALIAAARRARVRRRPAAGGSGEAGSTNSEAAPGKEAGSTKSGGESQSGPEQPATKQTEKKKPVERKMAGGKPASKGSANKKPAKKTTAIDARRTPKAVSAPGEQLPPEISQEQMRVVAARQFEIELAKRMHQDFGAEVVFGDAARRTLATELMSAREAHLAPGAARLRADLGFDAVVDCGAPRVTLGEGAMRDVRIWIEIDVAAPGAGATAAKHGRRPAGNAEPPPAVFSVGAERSSGHALFQSRFAVSRAFLTVSAAENAAALAEHTLRTGEPMLFDRPNTRVAILPVLVPERLDRLTYAPQGRRASSQPLAHGMLFGSTLMPFRPDLSPVAPANVAPETDVLEAMRADGMTPAALWIDERPDRAIAAKIGRRLNADYVFAARVTEVEIDSGPLSSAELTDLGAPSGPAGYERDARAEVTGALISTRTGRIVWTGFAAASMVTRSYRNGKPVRVLSEPEVIRDAAHFAVKRLERDFADFRSKFER